jgi:pimeloyl-ACP methyl ester carboxylesterase
MPFLDHDSVRIHFEDYGAGLPLIFSHGLGRNLSAARDLVGELPGARLIVYDNRGHGQTTGPLDPGEPNFEVLADDMAAVLDHVGVETAVVGGVSMGAGISIAFHRRHPRRVRALILNRPAWLNQPFPGNLSVIADIVRLMDTMGVEGALQRVEGLEAFAALRRLYPETANGLLQNLENARDASVAQTYRAILASVPFADFAELAAIRVPTLVLANHDDPIHPFEVAEQLAAAIPGSTLRAFPSIHQSWEEHRQGFRDCVQQFLGTL